MFHQVESLWPSLFARALSGCNVKAMIQSIAGAAMGGGGPPPVGGAPAGAGGNKTC